MWKENQSGSPRGWQWRRAIAGLLALVCWLGGALVLAVFPGGEYLVRVPLGEVKQDGKTEFNQDQVLDQFDDLSGLVLEDGSGILIPAFSELGSEARAAGRISLFDPAAPERPGDGVVLVDFCDIPSQSASLRLSQRPEIPPTFRYTEPGGLAAVEVRLGPPAASWQLEVSRRQNRLQVSLDGRPVALPACGWPVVHIRSARVSGAAVLTDWTLDTAAGRWTQSMTPRLVVGGLALLLAALLVLLGWRAVPLVVRLGRAVPGLARRPVDLYQRWMRRPMLRGATVLAVLVLPPLAVVLGAHPGQDWIEEQPEARQARPGEPQRLTAGRPQDLRLVARVRAEAAEDCHLILRHRGVPLPSALLGAARVEYHSWLSVPLGGGEFQVDAVDPAPGAPLPPAGADLELTVEGATASLRLDGVERARAKELPVWAGDLWLVSRRGLCQVSALTLTGAVPASAASYGGVLLWWGGLLALAGLLALTAADRRAAGVTLVGAAGLSALLLVPLDLWFGGVRWPVLAVPLALTVFAVRRHVTAGGWRARVLRPLLVLLSLVLLDVGLHRVAVVEALDLESRIAPVEFLLFHRAIGSHDWYRMLGRHPFFWRTFGPRPPAVTRVLCLGGSSTMGGGVNREELTYPWVLQEELRRRRPGQDIRVLNGGWPGYTSLNIRLLADRELEDLDPQLVVLNVGYNDCTHSFQPAAQRELPGQEPLRYTRHLRASSLWLLFRDLVLGTFRWASAMELVYSPISSTGFRENVAHLIELNRRAGRQTLLVAEPQLRRWERAGDPCGRYLADFLDLARETGTPLVDPSAVWGLARSLELFVDQVHMNEWGQAQLAADVAAAIVETPGLLPE